MYYESGVRAEFSHCRLNTGAMEYRPCTAANGTPPPESRLQGLPVIC